MDFFEHQDAARRSTIKLVVLFLCAVVGIVIAVNAVVLIGWNIWFSDPVQLVPPGREQARRLMDGQPVQSLSGGWRWFQPWPIGIATLATLLVISERMFTKSLQLRGGGGAVAQMLGGTPLTHATNPTEKKLQNVVEEMSIASGCPQPELYVMRDEPGINAFAAGTTPDNAAIGVTRGCLEALTRDELQGVVAHEFSHILNGDMRLNSRLIGVIFGISGIGMLGLVLIRSLAYTGSAYSRRRKNDDGRAIIVILVAGLTLAAIGYIGVFFGRMIQSAISRQREFLADASAVQFTRNKDGIADALKKIGGVAGQGAVRNPHAGEIAHMFFATGFSTGLSRLAGSLFATHPPLDVRIKRIDPAWDGKLKPVEGRKPFAGAAFAGETAMPLSDVTRRVGRIEPEAVAFAGKLIESLPEELIEATREPYSARAVCFAMLLDEDEIERDKQMRLFEKFEPPLGKEALRIAKLAKPLGPGGRLPLVDLCLPALGRMSDLQSANFCRLLRQLVEADGNVTPFEFALYTIIVRHLRSCPTSGEKKKRKAGQIHSIRPLLDPIRLLLSVMAKRSDNPNGAYKAGMARVAPELADEPRPELPMNRLTLSLDQLDKASPGIKRRVLDAAAHCVAADGVINVREAELLRGVAAALDLPLPPLVREAFS
ncbi:MAG: M48 family metallopeptidase [Planctomycetota bacterium]